MSSSTPEYEYEDYDKPKRKSAKGRKLVRWDPGLDQLVLLSVDYVCTKHAIAVPWDEVAQQVESFLTGEAIKQHLVKVYKYREDEGLKVPPKLDRNQRRKALAAEGGVTTPSGKRGKRNAAKEEEVAPAEPVKPGRSLLHIKPSAAKSKKVSTPAGGRGRKKAAQEAPDEYESDYEIHAAPKKKAKSTARGTKRGRNSTKDDYEDEAGDLTAQTPSKLPKTSGYLRARSPVHYSAQMAVDAEDGYDTYEDKPVDNSPKRYTADNNTTSFHEPAPRPAFNFTGGLPATPSGEHGPSPFNDFQVNGQNGLPGFRVYEGNYTTTPAMTPEDRRDFNTFARSPFGTQGNAGTGDGDPFVSASPFLNSQAMPNNFLKKASGTVIGTASRNDANTGSQNDSDNVDMNLNITNGGRNEHVPRLFTNGSDFFNDNFGGDFTTSPAELEATGDRSGITPAMAQTGFQMQTPLPEQDVQGKFDNSFDSGYGSHEDLVTDHLDMPNMLDYKHHSTFDNHANLFGEGNDDFLANLADDY